MDCWPRWKRFWIDLMRGGKSYGGQESENCSFAPSELFLFPADLPTAWAPSASSGLAVGFILALLRGFNR